MNRLIICLFALSLSSCAVPPDEPVDSSQAEIGAPISECAPAPGYCQFEPWHQLVGTYSTWASEDCTGEWARGALSGGLSCAQWHELGDTDGDVYCVDPSAPVEKIYFRDPSDGVCKPWTLTSERWFIWRWCGRHPLPIDE